MKHYFGGILRKIYKPSEKFFIKSPYPYLPKCTDPLKGVEGGSFSHIFTLRQYCENTGHSKGKKKKKINAETINSRLMGFRIFLTSPVRAREQIFQKRNILSPLWFFIGYYQ
jgi:hypothetical protein